MTTVPRIPLKRHVRDAGARLVLDAVAAATARKSGTSPRRRIGVFLFWGIGDAVLAIPFLHALRMAYPEARIDAIGKPWLEALFGDERLFDGYQTLVPPWTKHRGKYRLWSEEWRDFARSVRSLGRTEYDLLIGLRPDPRETALARLLATAEYAGYAAEGGRAWVSIDIGVDRSRHPFERSAKLEPGLYRGTLAARAAAALLGTNVPGLPLLAVRPPPDELVRRLREAGYRGGPILALAFGAAQATRRWSGERIGASLRGLKMRPGAILLIESEGSPSIALGRDTPTVAWNGSLSELKRVLTLADVLFCTDSGPMHIGAAVGCRVVALFGPGSLERFAPPPPHAVYAVEPMPCRPCSDYCIYSSPLCMDRLEPSAAAVLLDQALAGVGRPRAESMLPMPEVLQA
ncbi:MAG: glycosyltransferase family 9 protein [Proteobacteria bacterium]|nr:glycosyltransferase family 9 protein [Pseudomonadota bacterium]MBI3497934.1 glycosyltransferase family 9 protein [Pseudomonadota bacterium]